MTDTADLGGGGDFDGISRCRGLKVVKSCFGGISYSPVCKLLLKDVSFSHSTLRHRQTDRRQYRAVSVAVRSAKIKSQVVCQFSM